MTELNEQVASEAASSDEPSALPHSLSGPISNGTDLARDQSPENQTTAITRELHALEKLNIYFQMGLAIIGLAAVIIYGFELVQMRRTNSLMQQSQRDQALQQSDQMQLDEAAQLALIDPTIDNFESGQPTVRLTFHNFGKTPSVNGNVKIATALVGPGGNVANDVADVERSFRNMPRTASVFPITKVYSQTGLTIPITFNQPGFSRETVQKVMNGKNRVMFFGNYDYVDIFDRSHQDHFCVSFDEHLADPKQVFLKSFIRNYAKGLGSGEDDKDLKRALAAASQSIPTQPVEMQLCNAGND